jgi:pimeloyl-ACP methyl ester carboxylesterase
MKLGLFRDRREAGRLLAEKLAAYANRPDVLVLALPRGGVPVAYKVARALGAPLDIFVVRKLGVRGGRPDLAGTALTRVRAPTLLIVGGNDGQVIELNRGALARLRCEKQLVIVPGATHLFQEPGALDEVARLARNWFQRHLVAVA